MATPPPEAILSELNRLENLRDPMRDLSAKRQFDRFVVRGEAELHPMGRSRLDASPIAVQLRDVSQGGIGFVCARPLPASSSWRICFLNRGLVIGQQAMVVRHCREVGEGLYLVGARFVLDTGLLLLLGIDAGELMGADADDSINEDTGQFLPPAEVA